MMSQIDSRHWKISTDHYFQNGRHNTTKIRPVEIFQCRESIRDIIIYPHIKFLWYWTMLNFYRPYFMPHFENGRHFEMSLKSDNVSSKFDMWVDNDVPNWFPTLNNFYRSPFSKWSPPKPATDTIYPHIKFWWYWTMLNFCGIVAAILKMAPGRNCSMSGINSGHHYLQYHQNLICG
jgi:hypothetical protein